MESEKCGLPLSGYFLCVSVCVCVCDCVCAAACCWKNRKVRAALETTTCITKGPMKGSLYHKLYRIMSHIVSYCLSYCITCIAYCIVLHHVLCCVISNFVFDAWSYGIVASSIVSYYVTSNVIRAPRISYTIHVVPHSIIHLIAHTTHHPDILAAVASHSHHSWTDVLEEELSLSACLNHDCCAIGNKPRRDSTCLISLRIDKRLQTPGKTREAVCDGGRSLARPLRD